MKNLSGWLLMAYAMLTTFYLVKAATHPDDFCSDIIHPSVPFIAGGLLLASLLTVEER